jgi:redox-sensitive bicupin YhaK (pirin superfamily)
VKVVAGDVFGVRGPVETHSPIVYLHVTLQPGASVEVPIPPGHQAFSYVIRGRGRFGAEQTAAPESQLVLFAGDEGDVRIEAPDDADGPLDALVISGVMNTRDELVQAFDDYQSGAMGRIAARS